MEREIISTVSIAYLFIIINRNFYINDNIIIF